MKLILALSIALTAPIAGAQEVEVPAQRQAPRALETTGLTGFPTTGTGRPAAARISLTYGPMSGYWVDTETQEIYEGESSETPLPCGPERVEWNRITTYGSAQESIERTTGRIQRIQDKMSGLSCDLVFHREIRDIRTTPTDLDKRCAALDLTIHDRWLEPEFKGHYETEVLRLFAEELPDQLPAFERQLAARPEGSLQRYELLANAYGLFNSKNSFLDDLNRWTSAVVDYDVLNCEDHKTTYEAFIRNQNHIKDCNRLGRELQGLRKDLFETREQARLESESKAALNACISEQLGLSQTPQHSAEEGAGGDHEGLQ